MRALFLPLCAVTLSALAAPASDKVANDVSAAALAASCAGCHRDTAMASGITAGGAIPSLAGLSAVEIADKLKAYRSGELVGTLMNRLARGYSEAEIERLATELGTPRE